MVLIVPLTGLLGLGKLSVGDQLGQERRVHHIRLYEEKDGYLVTSSTKFKKTCPVLVVNFADEGDYGTGNDSCTGLFGGSDDPLAIECLSSGLGVDLKGVDELDALLRTHSEGDEIGYAESDVYTEGGSIMI